MKIIFIEGWNWYMAEYGGRVAYADTRIGAIVSLASVIPNEAFRR